VFRRNMKPGAKYFDWERRGVPLRIEVGPKDVEKNAVMTACRHERRKESVPLEALPERLPAILDEIQRDLLERARRFRDEHTGDVSSLDELAERLEKGPGFFRGGWDGDEATGAAVKERTNATIRVIPLEGGEPEGRRDLVSGKPAVHTVLYARAY
ncbi:MAG: His/Gly/Thr/Pro-type tRNA ligase C-terminal domain-containing protein, partial [Planctomycetota bacterium]